MGLVQPMACAVGMIRGGGLGIPPPHLGCLWFSRQCRRSSQLQLRSPPWGLSQSLCFSSFVATATGVTSCSSSADCLLSGPLVLRVCLRRDVVRWWFYSWWCSRFYLGQRYADDWKFFIYFQYQAFFGYVCLLNCWFSSNDIICAYNYFFPVQVEGMCCSEKWELYLFGRQDHQGTPWYRGSVAQGCVSASVLHPTWQRTTHHLFVVPAF